ncbi:hypothetical protein HDU96_009655 [Phlyctochytrium bullatum]|nr:hypothetical protein HDU96_009655 [Phlyctochytrium bullatum]
MQGQPVHEFDDDKYCKNFLFHFCPDAELKDPWLPNAGRCHKIHSPEMKALFMECNGFETRPRYKDDLERLCSDYVALCDQAIQNLDRLQWEESFTLKEEFEVDELLDKIEAKIMQMDEWKKADLVQKVAEGLVELKELQAQLRECENRIAAWDRDPANAQYRKASALRPCKICGAFVSTFDNIPDAVHHPEEYARETADLESKLVDDY